MFLMKIDSNKSESDKINTFGSNGLIDEIRFFNKNLNADEINLIT